MAAPAKRSVVKLRDVDKIALRDQRGGRAIRKATAQNHKKLAVELGMFQIAVNHLRWMPISIALVEGLSTALDESGDSCAAAGSRLRMQESIEEKTVIKIARAWRRLRVGATLR